MDESERLKSEVAELLKKKEQLERQLKIDGEYMNAKRNLYKMAEERVSELQGKEEELKVRLSELKLTVEGAKGQADEMRSLKLALKEKELELENLNVLLRRKSDSGSELEREKKEYEKAKWKLEESIKEHEKATIDARGKIGGEKILKDRDSEISSLKSELSEKDERIRKISQELSVKKEESARLREESIVGKSKREAISKLEAKVAELESSLAEKENLSSDNASLKYLLEEKDKKIVRLKESEERAAVYRASLEELKRELAKLTAKNGVSKKVKEIIEEVPLQVPEENGNKEVEKKGGEENEMDFSLVKPFEAKYGYRIEKNRGSGLLGAIRKLSGAD